MKTGKSKFSEGNAFLRGDDLPAAMVCFIEAIEQVPLLAGVINSNILHTQRYFNKNKCLEIVTYSVSADEYSSPSTNVIVLRDGHIAFNSESHQLHEGSIGMSLARFAAQHPASQLNDTLASPISLLLGLMYRLLWRTRVMIQVGKHPPVALDDFLQSEVDAPTLARLVLALQPVNVLLIQYLGCPQPKADSTAPATWPRKYAQLGALHGDLVESSSEQFLHNLFSLALGRPIQPHEYEYFTEQLETQQSTRGLIAAIVCGGEECKRHLADHAWRYKKTKKVYSHPEVGDVEPSDIHLPLHANPKVSVLIPVYEKVEYTLACLKSIADHPPKISFEVIVMDDRSPDGSASILQRVKNLRVVLNPQNLGFLRSCNNGVKHAKGEYLFFLNNDTQVKTGWLDELVNTFTIFPNCGLTGSKLIYPDGRLQEAGGIIWQDGSAWNYGNRQDPSLPQFNYAREVDYISGASIMVPKKLFDSLGGFDLNYIPAYCEDSDLALKIRDRGFRVIFQPASEVIHFEGISSGTDTTQGVKAYQVSNSQKLYQRWQHKLCTHRPNGQQADAEKDRRMRHRVLVLEHCTPTPDQDAGSVSVFNIMLLMREMDFQITFIPEDNYLYDPKYTTKLQKAGIEVLYSPHTTSVEKHLQEMGSRYDLVFLFRPKVVERNMGVVKRYAPQAKTLFYTHDIHHIRMEREAELLQSASMQTEADLMKEREFAAIRTVNSTIVVSTTEMEILQPQLPDVRLELLPLLLNIPGTNASFERRRGIVFVGGYQHAPNVDAVHYFVSEVMPHIRKYLPGVKFHIVGSRPPRSVLDLTCEDILVEGFIEELNPFLDTMRLAVAPLRYGAGVKGKVGTALASGLPVVATTIAAEGMEITRNVHALIADTPEEFAKQVADLYNNAGLWARLSQEGIRFADSKFGPSASYSALRRIIGRLGFDIPATPLYPLSLYSAAIN